MARGALVAIVSFVAVAAAGAAPPTFTNPVFRSDFPDPFVLRAGGTYYAYGTNTALQNVQTLRSSDLVHWRRGKDAMPDLAPWVLRGRTWAPEVVRLSDHRYVLYYSARSFDANVQCVGRAQSALPKGPFRDRSAKPLVCQKAEGGSIDASPFRDPSGLLYLLWKNDGNCCGKKTYLYSQRLSENGLALLGKRVRLVRNDAAWEGTTVEAPTMWKQGGKYFLFFSANVYNTEFYAVGYATCRGPLGPCTDSKDNPILTSKCRAVGPGHQALIRDRRGRTWIVYHAWVPGKIGSVTPGRVLWIDRIDWRARKPVVHGPTCNAQPAP